jgi:hypothetical protein
LATVRWSVSGAVLREFRGHARLAILAIRWARLVEVPLLPERVQVATDGIEFGLGPPAGHHAQQLAELRPELGLDGVPVGGSDHKHGLVLLGRKVLTATAAPVSIRSPRS